MNKCTGYLLVPYQYGAGGRPGANFFVYLDDIIHILSDFKQQLSILGKTFDMLNMAGLTVSRENCKFCDPSLHYLGFLDNTRGFKIDGKKVEVILNFPVPITPSE